MDNQYKKGAEWRKWDLHFHTPSSYDYKDNSVKDDDIIKILSKNNITVVAITDHHIIDTNRSANLQKLANYTFSTVIGSIENRDVNRKIVEVLEGAMPAFNKRKDKYYE